MADQVVHLHYPTYVPASGTGKATCTCGASVRMEDFVVSGPWLKPEADARVALPDLIEVIRDWAKRIEEACPCPMVRAVGCTEADWKAHVTGQYVEDPDCLCIARDGKPCGWPGHALASNMRALAAERPKEE